MGGWTGLTAAILAALGAGAAAGAPAPGGLPVSEADICAIAARPEMPGMDQMADPERGGEANAIRARPGWRTVLWGYDGHRMYGDWGACPVSRVGFDSLEVSADGRYALTDGGWQAGPLAGGWGHCLFEKIGPDWKPVACEITAIS